VVRPTAIDDGGGVNICHSRAPTTPATVVQIKLSQMNCAFMPRAFASRSIRTVARQNGSHDYEAVETEIERAKVDAVLVEKHSQFVR